MKNIAYFNIELSVECPECGEITDLEGGDDGRWIRRFRAWINNDPGAEDFEEPYDCDNCDHQFTIHGARR